VPDWHPDWHEVIKLAWRPSWSIRSRRGALAPFRAMVGEMTGWRRGG